MTTDLRVNRPATAISTAFVMLGSVTVQAHPGSDHWHPESGAAMLAVIAAAIGAGAFALLRHSLRQRSINKAHRRDAR